MSRQDVVDLATLSASFHAASVSSRERPAGVLDGRRVLHFPIKNQLADTPDALRAVLRDSLSSAQRGVDSFWSNAYEQPRLIHADLTPNNVLRHRGRLAAIDFQDMTWGHVQHDVANTLCGITRGVDVEATTRVFRSSYEQIRPWPHLGEDLLADLIAARRLEMVNLALITNRRRSGSTSTTTPTLSASTSTAAIKCSGATRSRWSPSRD